MPVFTINNKHLGVYIMTGYKRYGIYLFEPPNIWYKVATFHNEESAEHFIDYLSSMFQALIERGKENEIDRCR